MRLRLKKQNFLFFHAARFQICIRKLFPTDAGAAGV